MKGIVFSLASDNFVRNFCLFNFYQTNAGLTPELLAVTNQVFTASKPENIRRVNLLFFEKLGVLIFSVGSFLSFSNFSPLPRLLQKNYYIDKNNILIDFFRCESC